MVDFLKKQTEVITVFVVFVLVRLPLLGMDIVNSDAYWWKTRSYNFGNALSSLDFALTAQTYHPGVTLMWINYFGIKIFTLLDQFIFKGRLNEQDLFLINHIIQKSFLVFVFGVLFALTFSKIKLMFGKIVARYFFVLLTFTPYFLGLTRVLHTDALVTFFLFLSFLYLYSYFDELKKVQLIIAGGFTALALLTKSNSLLFIPFALLVIFIENILSSTVVKFDFRSIVKRFSKDNFIAMTKEGLIYFSGLIFTFIALWPAMWVVPFQTLKNYLFGVTSVGIEEGHTHFFMGQITNNPGFMYYLYSFVGRIDEVLLTLFVLGTILFIKNKSKIENRYIFYALLFILVFILGLTFPSKKIDRYILPVFPFVVLVATFFLAQITKRLRLKNKFIFLILLLNLLILDIKYHPDYLAYYSQFLGGPYDGRYYVDNTWPMGYPRLASYFNSLDRAEDLKVAVHDDHSFRPYFSGVTVEIENEKERNLSDYVVTFSYYPENFSLEGLEKVADFDVVNIPYYTIYKNLNKH